MGNKRNMDPADQALAEEFGDYISEVASKIIAPIQKVTETSNHSSSQTAKNAVTRIEFLVDNHIDQFSADSHELTSTLIAIKDDMKKVVSTIAEGHERTRTALLTYAIQHSKDARDEMKAQTEKLERSFVEAIEPKVQKLNDDVLSRFERIVIDHQRLAEKSFAQLKVGLALLAVQIAVIGIVVFFLSR